MIDYEYYFDQYRRVPRNSATTNRDLLEFQSTATYSSYASWARSSRRPLTTTYIDGSTFFGIDHRPMTTKGLFPKGKGRRKPSATSEKRLVRNVLLRILFLKLFIRHDHVFRILPIHSCH